MESGLENGTSKFKSRCLTARKIKKMASSRDTGEMVDGKKARLLGHLLRERK